MTCKTKVCPDCKQEKPVTAENFKRLKNNPFYPTPKAHDDGTGFAIRCNECKRVERIAAQRAWRKKNADRLTKHSYAYRKEQRRLELLRRMNPTDGIPWAATTHI